MSAITTHVLDTSRGRPAEGVPVILKIFGAGGKWRIVSRGATNADGRVPDLLPKKAKLKRAIYCLTFETAAYYRTLGTVGFYPVVVVTFSIHDAGQHYHVPLLLSPFGYSTYRGS